MVTFKELRILWCSWEMSLNGQKILLYVKDVRCLRKFVARSTDVNWSVRWKTIRYRYIQISSMDGMNNIKYYIECSVRHVSTVPHRGHNPFYTNRNINLHYPRKFNFFLIFRYWIFWKLLWPPFKSKIAPIFR